LKKTWPAGEAKAFVCITEKGLMSIPRLLVRSPQDNVGVVVIEGLKAGDALIAMIERTTYGRLTAAEALGHREFMLTKLYRSA
jgi:hypothetical protein